MSFKESLTSLSKEDSLISTPSKAVGSITTLFLIFLLISCKLVRLKNVISTSNGFPPNASLSAPYCHQE